jgi:signal transduction histidine kinase
VLASALVSASLVGLVWLDYRATRGELVELLREQASQLQAAVAAAASSNRAAAALAERQLGERLLDQARSLARLDAEGRLTQAEVDALVAREPLFRVAVFTADGRREPLGSWSAGDGHGPGPSGPGGAGAGGGPGRGGGFGGGPSGRGLLQEILRGERQEGLTGIHANRWGTADRLSAAARRKGGGAILLSIDATAVAALQRPASLEALLEAVARGNPDVAYVVIDGDGGRVAVGDEAASAGEPPAVPGEREHSAGGRPVLELASALSLDDGTPATLRLGVRLDGVRRVERRMALRLALSLLAAASLVALAFGLSGLRVRYGRLSEKHALAEQALRRRDRLAAMGELASTVAHEVRNPLNAVAMTAQRLRREYLGGAPADRAELEELLGVMASETQRIDRIVQQFLDFARPPRLAPEPTALGALARELVERTRALAQSRGVALTAEVLGRDDAVVDPSQLGQVIDNLLRNAIEATPAGGSVTVRVSPERDGHVVEVADTGRGIEPDVLPRIFDLYFTTREDGTGIGLAVAQQVVAAHGGTIEVDSQPGRGTRMVVRLPRSAGEAGRG